MSYIYLASPYTHPDKVVMQKRYQANIEACSLILAKGITVYSPLVHMHPIAVAHDLPRDFDFWIKHNLNMIKRSNLIGLLQLEGWEESKGVKWEIDFARYANIEVFLWTMEDLKGGEDLFELAKSLR